jgi:hypothetical protein
MLDAFGPSSRSCPMLSSVSAAGMRHEPPQRQRHGAIGVSLLGGATSRRRASDSWVARSVVGRPSRAEGRPPNRVGRDRPLDLGMFGERKRILDVDTKVSDCTLVFVVA